MLPQQLDNIVALVLSRLNGAGIGLRVLEVVFGDKQIALIAVASIFISRLGCYPTTIWA